MTYRYDCMIAGHLCLDIIPRFSSQSPGSIGELMRPGKLVNVAEAAISTGGPVSNTGLNMKKLGNTVCFCACVGEDSLGQLTRGIMSENGNVEGIRAQSAQGSSYTLVIAPPHIDRIFLHNPGPNDLFGPEMLDPALIAQCRHFHFGYPPLMRRMFDDGGESLRRTFQIAKEAGATTSCDMTLPDPDSPSGQVDWRRILERILPFVDLFLPSIEETFYMLYPEEFLNLKRAHNDAELIDHLSPTRYSRLAEEALAMGTHAVALKSGHRGFYLRTGDLAGATDMVSLLGDQVANWSQRELWAPAFAVEHLASATGSGDSSIAGLLSAYLRGQNIEHALKCATCLGWQNIQELDAISGIHSWPETQALINQKMPLIDAHLQHEPGWRWEEMSGLWFGPGDAAQD